MRSSRAWMRSSRVWMKSSWVWMKSGRVWMRSNRVGMRSSRLWTRSSRAWMRSSRVWMKSNWVWMKSCRVWMRSSLVWMISSRVWMRLRSSRVLDEIQQNCYSVWLPMPKSLQSWLRSQVRGFHFALNKFALRFSVELLTKWRQELTNNENVTVMAKADQLKCFCYILNSSMNQWYFRLCWFVHIFSIHEP
jgi:hypothetical protein